MMNNGGIDTSLMDLNAAIESPNNQVAPADTSIIDGNAENLSMILHPLKEEMAHENVINTSIMDAEMAADG